MELPVTLPEMVLFPPLKSTPAPALALPVILLLALVDVILPAKLTATCVVNPAVLPLIRKMPAVLMVELDVKLTPPVPAAPPPALILIAVLLVEVPKIVMPPSVTLADVHTKTPVPLTELPESVLLGKMRLILPVPLVTKIPAPVFDEPEILALLTLVVLPITTPVLVLDVPRIEILPVPVDVNVPPEILIPTPVFDSPDKIIPPLGVLLSVVAPDILRPVPLLDVPERLSVPLPRLL